jgi:hypothetical protein
MTQVSLDFAPVADTRDHTARWRAFCVERPDVAARVLAWCREQRDAGQARIGMAKCWEAIGGTIGKGKSLCNSLRAPAARWLVEQDPTLAGLIEMRRRKAA